MRQLLLQFLREELYEQLGLSGKVQIANRSAAWIFILGDVAMGNRTGRLAF